MEKYFVKREWRSFVKAGLSLSTEKHSNYITFIKCTLLDISGSVVLSPTAELATATWQPLTADQLLGLCVCLCPEVPVARPDSSYIQLCRLQMGA